jgi:hypothetical protein
MTTGCCCGTPGGPGVAPGPRGLCPDCRTEAMAPGLRRLVRQAIIAVLGPPELAGVDLLGRGRLTAGLSRDGAAREGHLEPEAGS